MFGRASVPVTTGWRQGQFMSSAGNGSISLVADLMLQTDLAELRRPQGDGFDATLAAGG